MATTGALTICRVCKELLVDGLCPNQHTSDDYKSLKDWPTWIVKPNPLIAQERKQLSDIPKVHEEEDRDPAKIKIMHEVNTAYELVEDHTFIEMMYDVSILVQRSLIHKRSPETIQRIVSMAKHMAKMAEATEAYIRECRITRV